MQIFESFMLTIYYLIWIMYVLRNALRIKGLNLIFYKWSASRLTLPKDKVSSLPPVKFGPVIFKYGNTEFDPYSVKSKEFYALLITKKVKYPKSFITLSADLELSNTLQEVFSTPYDVASETYIWSFQYKLSNNILFKNAKLFRIGLIESEKYSFCAIYKEDIYHLFYYYSYVRALWKRFCNWWSNLLSENLSLSLKDIIVGILNRKDILNYLITLGKLCVYIYMYIYIYIWDCGRNKSVPKFDMFLHKVEAKQETKRFISLRNKKL